MELKSSRVRSSEVKVKSDRASSLVDTKRLEINWVAIAFQLL
jgi:hypothetical protein